MGVNEQVETYEKNIRAIFEVNQLLAGRLVALEGIKNFEIFQGNDPIDINLLDVNNHSFIYSKPLEFLTQEIEKLRKYDRYPYLYFFGLGNGVFYKSIVGTDTFKTIYVVEPNLEVIYITLHMIDFSQEILDGKFRLFYSQDIDFGNGVGILSHNQVVYGRVFELFTHAPYYEIYQSELERVNQVFLEVIKYYVYSYGNDVIDSLVGIEHHIHNLPLMLSSAKLSQFPKVRNSETAIIVSTGPSLDKQIPLLKEIADYVTILCVDASFPVLYKHGIKPDIVCSLERVVETAQFFTDVPREFQEGITFVQVSLQHEKAINAIDHDKQVLVMRPFGYNIVFDFKEFGYIGFGMSAANMAHDLAFIMGFSNCVLIGQDLAYAKDGKTHSNDHVRGTDDVNRDVITDKECIAYGGEGMIRTTHIWELFRNYFEKNIVNTNDKMRTINSTEGGARINGAEEVPFKDVVEALGKVKRKEKLNLVRESKEEYLKNYARAKSRLNRYIKIGKKYQEESTELFLELQEFSKNLVDLNITNQLDKIDFNEVGKLNEKIDKLKGTIMEDSDFKNFYFDVFKSILMHEEMELAKIQVKGVENEMDIKTKNIEWLMQHQRWFYLLAGNIDAELEIVNRAKKVMFKNAKRVKKYYEESL